MNSYFKIIWNQKLIWIAKRKRKSSWFSCISIIFFMSLNLFFRYQNIRRKKNKTKTQRETLILRQLSTNDRDISENHKKSKIRLMKEKLYGVINFLFFIIWYFHMNIFFLQNHEKKIYFHTFIQQQNNIVL